MTRTLAHAIADQIRAAREAKALTQRALAEQVGIPQSHISRIERGTVDLQLSSLIQIARALDLELVLAPRGMLPMLASYTSRQTISETPGTARMRSKLNTLRLQANKLARRFPDTAVLKRLSQDLLQLRDLPVQRPGEERDPLIAILDELGRVLRQLALLLPSVRPPATLLQKAESLERDLRAVRTEIAHGKRAGPVAQTPAYTLDDNENGDD